MVLITLQSLDGLISTTKFNAQLFTTSEKVSVGICKGCSCTQIASRIGSFRLEGDGGRLQCADLDIAIQEVAIRHLGESNIGVFHRLQTGEIIVSSLQGRCVVRSALLDGGGIEEYLTAKMNIVAIVAQIVHLADDISGMIYLWRTTVCLVLHQLEGECDVAASRNGICSKLDEILVESEVTLIAQKTSDAFSLRIKSLYREASSGLEHLVFGLVEMQKLLDPIISHLILHASDCERLTGMKEISSFEFLLFLLCQEGNPRVHISLVLHRLQEVTARKACLERVEDDRLTGKRILEQ